MAISKINQGEAYENEEVKLTLERLNFVRQDDGSYLKPPMGGSRGQKKPGVRVAMKMKPDHNGQERIYLYVDSTPFEALGGMVYAPEKLGPKDIIGCVRDWMKQHHLL